MLPTEPPLLLVISHSLVHAGPVLGYILILAEQFGVHQLFLNPVLPIEEHFFLYHLVLSLHHPIVQNPILILG